MKKSALCLFIFFQLGTSSLPCAAISGNEQVELAGSGQFEVLWQKLEEDAAKKALKTVDLHALCFAFSKTKRYNKLLPCLDRLESIVKQGDKRTRLFGLDDATPTVHLMRGEALVELGQYSRAIDEAKKALAWFKETKSDDKDVEINAIAVEALASTFDGKRRDAEKYADELDQVDTSWPLHSDFKSIKAIAVAKVNMALGRYDRTFAAISEDKAFAVHAFLDKLVSGAFLSGKNNWAWQELPRSFMLNKALFGMGRLAEAKEGYDQLLKIPQVRENGDIYWLLLHDRGRIAESEGKLDEAIDLYRKAIEIIESQRSSINTEASKIGFVGDKQQAYGRVINALFKRGQQGEALEYIERSKSRALVDLLAAKQTFALPGKSGEQVATLLKVHQDAEAEALAQIPVSATEGKSQQRSVSTKTIEQLRSVAPELSALVSVTSMSMKALQELVPRDEVMIQYYYQDTSFYAFVMTSTTLKTVPLDAEGLEDDVRKFRIAISARDESAKSIAQSLYKRLVAPIRAMLDKKNLLIVPHGVLHYLPFAALHDGENYLLDRFSLRMLPSASVLKYLKRPREDKLASLLVFGNPDLGDRRLDLPNAQIEAEDVAKSTPNAKLLLRKQASATAFEKFGAAFRYIHFAAHGQFDSVAPLNSSLLLAKDGANDGMLTVDKLYSVSLNADLVTLSACETGLGKISNGDDVVGLTRAFLYAGAGRVIASLWQVDDAATSQLMRRFYVDLKKMSVRDALRDAQLEAKKKFSHPYFWSAFYLTGNS